MQLHIKDEAVRRGGTPALSHSRIRNRIKRRIYFDHFEMLRVPTKSLIRAQLFRVPVPDKTRIGPAGGADKNFSIFRIDRISRSHAETGIRGAQMRVERANLGFRSQTLNSKFPH